MKKHLLLLVLGLGLGVLLTPYLGFSQTKSSPTTNTTITTNPGDDLPDVIVEAVLHDVSYRTGINYTSLYNRYHKDEVAIIPIENHVYRTIVPISGGDILILDTEL